MRISEIENLYIGLKVSEESYNQFEHIKHYFHRLGRVARAAKVLTNRKAQLLYASKEKWEELRTAVEELEK